MWLRVRVLPSVQAMTGLVWLGADWSMMDDLGGIGVEKVELACVFRRSANGVSDVGSWLAMFPANPARCD
jgi:hypothetical protein